jgi:hypothetical protein
MMRCGESDVGPESAVREERVVQGVGVPEGRVKRRVVIPER